MTRKKVLHEPDAEKDGIRRPCALCGYWRGTVGKPLTPDERAALLRHGYRVSKNAVGDDIAIDEAGSHWSDARAWFHKAGHPGPPPTAWEHLLQDKL